MIILNMGGHRKIQPIREATDFLDQLFGDALAEQSNRDVQRELWQRLQIPSESVDRSEAQLAELCLRCFISYQIDQTCAQLVAKFGQNHGFVQTDLLSFVLSDDGRLRQKKSTEKLDTSFATTILNTFDINRAGLGYWVSQRVKQHPDLNQFLLEQGIYRVSDWAILNDTSVAQLRRILAEFYPLSHPEINIHVHLLVAYHQVYRGDRLKAKTRQGRVCLPPSKAQLQRMVERVARTMVSERSRSPNLLSSPSKVMTSLRQLASYLRQYRIDVRGGRRSTVSLDDPDVQMGGDLSTDQRAVDDDTDSFLEQYRVQFVACLDQAIAEVVGDRMTQLKRRKNGTADRFAQGLHLFHCRGMPMGAIAKSLNLKAQYQVTRLLKLKEVRADIRRALLTRLGASVQALALPYMDISTLQKVDAQIAIALAEQVDAIIQEAELETSVARHHPLKSLLARHLCQYLTQYWTSVITP